MKGLLELGLVTCMVGLSVATFRTRHCILELLHFYLPIQLPVFDKLNRQMEHNAQKITVTAFKSSIRWTCHVMAALREHDITTAGQGRVEVG